MPVAQVSENGTRFVWYPAGEQRDGAARLEQHIAAGGIWRWLMRLCGTLHTSWKRLVLC